jgi:hypothetical protein
MLDKEKNTRRKNTLSSLEIGCKVSLLHPYITEIQYHHSYWYFQVQDQGRRQGQER